MNSGLIIDYYREFINCTVNIQINDIRQVPVVIPSNIELQKLEPLFKKAVELKQSVAKNKAPEETICSELLQIERNINDFVETLYGL